MEHGMDYATFKKQEALWLKLRAMEDGNYTAQEIITAYCAWQLSFKNRVYVSSIKDVIEFCYKINLGTVTPSMFYNAAQALGATVVGKGKKQMLVHAN